MALHVFGAIVTARGVAANNRGLNEGNVTTLQKLVYGGEIHTTVSAEAIRFAVRRRLAESEECNRTYNDDARTNEWKDPKFSRWGGKPGDLPFIDDDILGYMALDGPNGVEKGSAQVRRARLEISRAISLDPWSGDVTFNAASPGATPAAQKKGSNPVPYGTEMHATCYQYGFALTPSKLHVPARASTTLRALCALGTVAGNHGRFLFDFSPESVVFRVTHDPAPRVLYGFSLVETRVTVDDVIRKVKAGDILASELVIGGAVVENLSDEDRLVLGGARLHNGVRAACEEACKLVEAGA